jgi:hypothetical protein
LEDDKTMGHYLTVRKNAPRFHHQNNEFPKTNRHDGLVSSLQAIHCGG